MSMNACLIIATLTLDVENAKHDCDVVIDSKNELEKCFAKLKSENEVLKDRKSVV